MRTTRKAVIWRQRHAACSECAARLAGMGWHAALLGVTLVSVARASSTSALADGGAEWTFTGTGGGAVHALTSAPNSPDVLYAGTETGGIFKSTDAGVAWHSANVGLNMLEGGALAIDSAARRTLCAAGIARGVCKSTDHATTGACG